MTPNDLAVLIRTSGMLNTLLSVQNSGSTRLQTNFSGMKINLLPLQRYDFAFGPPSGEVSKPNHRLQVLGKLIQKGFELNLFKEPFSDVVFRKHWDMRLHQDLTCFNSQGKGTFQGR